MNFLKNNYQWIFSGIGVLILSIILGIGINKKKNVQKIGKNSKGVIAGRDITIGTLNDEPESRE